LYPHIINSGLAKPKHVTKTMYYWLYFDDVLFLNKLLYEYRLFTQREEKSQDSSGHVSPDKVGGRMVLYIPVRNPGNFSNTGRVVWTSLYFSIPVLAYSYQWGASSPCTRITIGIKFGVYFTLLRPKLR